MRLSKVRVQKYRSVKDTGWFDVENGKTILVGPNEAGKTAVLQALQQIMPPTGVKGFDALRDYPRSEYNDITSGRVQPGQVCVAFAQFALESDDIGAIPAEFQDCTYNAFRYLDNTYKHSLTGGPAVPTWHADLEKDFKRLASHADKQYPEGAPEDAKPSATLEAAIAGLTMGTTLAATTGKPLLDWLESAFPHIEEGSKDEERYDALKKILGIAISRDDVLRELRSRVPVFVLFNNYFRVKPLIQLDHLATRTEQNVLDDEQYDYGNLCLLKLLGFTPRQLSDLGAIAPPAQGDAAALQGYRDQLDKRQYQLNAAEVTLTREIGRVWNPSSTRPEAERLRIRVDGQYLKVVVEDDLGVEIELDQRSEGFQWLVSFFVVFFAEAADKHDNAILLLDEPGLSLHGLKQREFRSTLSRLADENQTIYTTHSPFLVGPDELDLVRVVEMNDRATGTIVHTTVAATDPAALLPLQEALGYDLAQSLFAQQKNLVLEGLTDYWYLEATSQLLRDAAMDALPEDLALIPAQSAGKVAYFATILHAHNLKVAALLDSDAAGDSAASQDTLVHTLGNRRILRTKDVYTGAVAHPEIEDLLRETLVQVAKDDLGWDVTAKAASQPSREIVELFAAEIQDFSKYKLAKAYLRWTRSHDITDLTTDETASWQALISNVIQAIR